MIWRILHIEEVVIPFGFIVLNIVLSLLYMEDINQIRQTFIIMGKISTDYLF